MSSSKGLKQVKFKKGADAARDINVTPLIDVVLVLLIIFMVGSAIPTHEVEPSLPDKTETVQQDDMPKDQLVAQIYADGTVALNLQSMSLEELQSQVKRRLMGRPTKVVFVDAHPDANYGRVVQVMDAARDAGAEKVGIVSLKDEGPALPSVGGAPAVPGAPVPPTPPAPPPTP